MKRLIITADDYGMSLGVNEAIDAGIEAGIITSTNVMTNMPFYKEAQKLRNNADVSLGIHWTLSCGEPVLNKESIPSLIAEDGQFYSYPEFRSRYRKRLIANEDIKRELVAQYNRFVESCGEPDYWNTHQNVHVDFHIYQLFVSVAKELGILKMRSHQRIYVPRSGNDAKQPFLWRMMEPAKSALLNAWQGKAHKQGIKSPEGLIVCLNNTDVDRLEYLFSHIQWSNHEIGEYVIHPATTCDSPYFGKIIDHRMAEYKMFSNRDTKRLIEENGIQICNFSIL